MCCEWVGVPPPYPTGPTPDRTMSAARTMLALLDKVRDVRLC